MAKKRPANSKRSHTDTRITIHLEFEEAVKRLLNTHPPGKETHPPRKAGESRPE